LQAREIKRTANLVISSDKGLCGGYNANLVRLVLAEIPRDAGDAQRTRVLGGKGGMLLAAKRLPLVGVYEDHVEKIASSRVRSIVRDLVKEFLDGEVDQVRLIYTAFESAAKQRPVVATLLPIRPEDLVAQAAAGAG